MEVADVGAGSSAQETSGPEPVEQQQPDQPGAQSQVSEPKPLEADPDTSVTKRGEVRQYGDFKRAQIEGALREDDADNDDDTAAASTIAGAVRGSRAAQTEIAEQQVRDSGQLRVEGTDAFRAQVANDLNRIAPGTTVDSNGVVNKAATRVPGREQGYRLVDQLINNPNQVTIRYQNNNAYAITDDWHTAGPQNTRAGGTVSNPNAGTGMDVYYDPQMAIDLPTHLPDGRVVDTPANSAVVLAHELSHASHGQRGTLDLRVGTPPGQSPTAGSTTDNHFFANDGSYFKELQHDGVFMREEFRTAGFNGFRHPFEPSENSIRAELGYDPRAAYIGDGQYISGGQPSPGHVPSSALEAGLGNTRLGLNNAATTIVDGVRHSGRSAAIGGGLAFVTSAYEQCREGKPLDEAAGEVLTQTALGAGTGVAEEVIERAVSGAPSVTSGATNNAFRLAANQARGAGVAGAVINGAFAAYDQIGAYQRGEVTGSEALGTVTAEAAVGAASGLAGAYAGAAAGAAIGSIIPGAGTVVGGVVGFAVGAAAGYLADKGLRGLGVDQAIASGVTAAIDFGSSAVNTISETASNLVSGAADAVGGIAEGAVSSLKSVFGW